MARLYLFAEGQTEQTFAHSVLSKHLAFHGVFMQPPLLIAHARKHGKVHRGGALTYAPMKNDILNLLAQEKSRDVFFTTMIDLYAIPADFPGLGEAERLRHLPTERVELLEKCFAEDIDDKRFIPFIQLHEYEAYLFADLSCFEIFFDPATKGIAELQKIADSKASPELINDGQHTAPSKRIIAQFPGYDGAKPRVGPQAAELIGLDVIRNKCPHFSAWLTRLEQLNVMES